MARKICGWLLAMLFLLTPYCARALPVDTHGASAMVLLEPRSARILMEEGAQTEAQIAGLARLPALLLVCEALDAGELAESDAVRVSAEAAAIGGPTAFLSAGETIALSALLKSAVMITAGDAIYALSEALEPSEAAFAQRVNARMQALSITASCTDRLGNGLRMCARDLAALGGALVKSPSFCAYSMLFYDSITHENGSTTELASGNRLLKSCVGCNGVATGSSTEAGYCGVYAAQRGDTALICAVLGAPNAKARNAAAGEALEYAFATWQSKLLAKRGQVFAESIPLTGGSVDACALIAAEDLYTVLPAGGAYTRREEIPESLAAPLRAGDVLGEIVYLDGDGGKLAGVALTVAEDIPAAAFQDRLAAILRTFLHA